MTYYRESHRPLVRSLAATSLIVVVSLLPVAHFDAARLARAQTKSVDAPSSMRVQESLPAPDGDISPVGASLVSGGVLVQWRVNTAIDNVRLRVYRIRASRHTIETVSVGSLSSVAPVRVHGGYFYQWLDTDGTVDAVYYIESINLNDPHNVHDALIPVARKELRADQRADSILSSSARTGVPQQVNEYPAAMATAQPQSPQAAIDTQWIVAAQSGLKIQVKSDGWYRVTQQQMAAAGFNPVVDIRNLSLFGDGQEIAIHTNRDKGPLTSGDFIEFYGRGLDTLETDTRIYYLIAGTSAGKRAGADLRLDSPPSTPPAPLPAQPGVDFNYRGWFAPLVALIRGEVDSTTPHAEVAPVPQQAGRDTDLQTSSQSRESELSTNVASTGIVEKPRPSKPLNEAAIASAVKAAASAVTVDRKMEKKRRSAQRKPRQRSKQPKLRHNHSFDQAAGPVLSFADTVEVRERFNYNAQLPVGHNFIGSSISFPGSVTKTVSIHNVQLAADGSARLEVSLQGFTFAAHQVNIFVNNVMVGTMSFSGRDHLTQTFNVPVSQLVEGDNTVKFTPVGSGDSEFFDYLKLTYPHKYRASGDALRFSLRSTQSLSVDGFSTPNVQLVDISDPSNIKMTVPIVTFSGADYSFTVPAGTRGKSARLMYAFPQGQFQTPAGLSLNQPSTLNAHANRADLLIISHKDFIPALAPLVAQRQSQAQPLEVLVADIDDVYDEFSFGAHSSQALEDFLSYAYAPGHWTKAPKYVLLMGDANYDPRGNFSTVLTRSQVRQHDGSHPGCADAGDNGRDFSVALFPLPRNRNFNATPCSDASGLVISEIYDGGGDKANSYANGYIELFNRGPSAVNVNGWSVQYASATGPDWQVTNLSNVTIDPGHYYLVQEAGQGGFYPLAPPFAPAPDAIGNISINHSQGRIALVNTTTPLTGACPSGSSIVDLVGYGSAVTCYQGGSPAAVSGDFVPTQQVDTVFGSACSDDGLADFDNNGIPEIPVGRLPARTPFEANLMVSKIVNFSKNNVPQNALLVADAQGSYYWNFESHSDDLGNLIPQSIAKQKIYLAQQQSAAACRTNIINSINQGVALVNYQGHGNVNVWSGSNIFTSSDAYALTNGNKLPLMIVADCLNGLFDDPVLEGLAELLLKAPAGGAVAAYASSGETIPDGQQEMSACVFQLLFGSTSMALGDVTKSAKSCTTDLDVRRTWILIGDPSMKIW